MLKLAPLDRHTIVPIHQNEDYKFIAFQLVYIQYDQTSHFLLFIWFKEISYNNSNN